MAGDPPGGPEPVSGQEAARGQRQGHARGQEQEPGAEADAVGEVDWDALADQLKPLGNPTRLRLLQVLTQPRYLEELAEEVGMTRQGVRGHVEELVRIGVVRKRLGTRPTGTVTEYLLHRPRLFLIHTTFSSLTSLRPDHDGDEHVVRTVIEEDDGPGTAATGRGQGRHTVPPRLTIVHGLDEGRVFALPRSQGAAALLGRGADADIRIDFDPFLSHRHAEVRCRPEGYTLTDAFSRNGTRLNWERMPRGATSLLFPGDVVGIGRTLLVFQGGIR